MSSGQPPTIPLAARIAEEIRDSGPMRLSRFIELALYEPGQGYYRHPRDPFGKQGDFFTNSQLQPVFGRLLAARAEHWRQHMGCPPDFQVVDWGCGRGETVDVLRHALPGVAVTGVDLDAPEPPTAITGIIFANELFDALPVDLIERRGKGLVELRVVESEPQTSARGQEPSTGRFRFVPCPASPGHADYIRLYAPDLAAGQQIEVSLAGLALLENLAARLIRGYLVVIDYGYTTEEVARARRFPFGSLMSYYRHQASADILSDAGRRDISSHVNFSALESRARQLGFEPLGLVSQTRFLLDAGEPDEFAAALAADDETQALRLRLQLKTLLVGLGETFRVLTLRK